MMNSRIVAESLSSSDLRSARRELVRRSHGDEAALLVHLGEIDERKVYLDWAFSSMFRDYPRRDGTHCVGTGQLALGRAQPAIPATRLSTKARIAVL